jgi:hypothetical protein
MKQTHAAVLVTPPGTHGVIRCSTSMNQAVGGSSSRKRLSDIICQKSD